VTQAPTDKKPQDRIRADGKASFDSIYDQPTPAAYFSALKPLAYMTPGRVQPMVRRCVAALRHGRGIETVTVLDLCAGYGVNAALLKYRLGMQDLYERYATANARAAGHKRIAADALWYARKARAQADVRVIAQDVALNALTYSHAVGLADVVVGANLEERDPSEVEAAQLGLADLIVVTGGLSYIGEKSFRRVLGVARRRPWALYFPLRHSDTDDIDEAFERAGYEVETARRTIQHRFFRSPEERRAIRARVLADAGEDERPPSSTYLEALIKLARPPGDVLSPPFDEIVSSDGEGSRRDEAVRTAN